MRTTHPILKKTTVIALLGFWLCFSGCASSDEEVIPSATDERLSFKINGTEYSGSASSLGDDDYFYLWGVASINDYDGYSIQLELNNPKVGTFTAPKNSLKASVASLKGTIANPKIQEYKMPTNGKGTFTLSRFDTKGYAEGTFSFTGQTDTGQKLEVTDGKFRIDLR
ncbi:hypothetical protein GCM10028807_23660 [Spirosoma daeguense]